MSAIKTAARDRSTIKCFQDYKINYTYRNPEKLFQLLYVRFAVNIIIYTELLKVLCKGVSCYIWQ